MIISLFRIGQNANNLWRKSSDKMQLKFSIGNVQEFQKEGENKRFILLLAICLIFSLTFSACAKEVTVSPNEVGMVLFSTAFVEGGKIPVKYTADGQNISPPLDWSDSSQLTKTFALIVDDPDAPGGVFTHWVIFDIPANNRHLDEGISTQGQLENGELQGKNDFGKIGYTGPAPPSGSTHHYRFTIYALDNSLDLKFGASKQQLIVAMNRHILARGQLIGVYEH